jgi:cell wall-associated NlpC family hydrolase
VNRRATGPTVVGIALALLLCLLVVPMLVVGGTAMLFAGGDGSTCGSTAAPAVQPTASNVAANSIPADYLHWFQFVGLQYNVPWTILAGIGKVESDDGQTTLPGVNSGTNAFGAAGPMQIGVEGASCDAWATYATVEDGNPPASVYKPADAIAAAAKYLIAHGVQQNVPEAIFAYNHADWYVQEVLSWASTYASGGYTISEVTPNGDGTADDSVLSSTNCKESSELASFVAPNAIVGNAVNYAEEQLGKPYLWGGTGPSAYDCSGLVMMAYESAGVAIPRTSQEQWKLLPHVPASKVLPGDLVFFAGGDGTVKAPGHVGLVVGKHTMIEAYAPGTPIRVSQFGTPQSAPGDTVVVGYARPWSNKDANT